MAATLRCTTPPPPSDGWQVQRIEIIRGSGVRVAIRAVTSGEQRTEWLGDAALVGAVNTMDFSGPGGSMEARVLRHLAQVKPGEYGGAVAEE